MDIGILRGLLTLVLMLAFLGIAFWAYSKKRKKDFEEAARLPLEEDGAGPREYRHE
ncbi:MAG: cbb3-type cytochrome oxidase subunit 3 [Gammaproteobacteria bacterium]|jgi:cytochrome c oxidase cbb3-type subunit 4